MKHFQVKSKLSKIRLADLLQRFNPFRGELVDIEVKMVGKRIVYHYTKVRQAN